MSKTPSTAPTVDDDLTMKRYRATKVFTLASGSVVTLDDKQAADRKGRIERVGPGRYRLLDAMQFKAGEVFGYEGELPKAVAHAGADPEPVAVAVDPEPVADRSEKSAASQKKTK